MTKAPAIPDLRKRVLAARRSQDPAERDRKSALIFGRWRDAIPRGLSWSGRQVSLYRSMAEEVSLGLLERFLAEAGARLYFPRLPSREATEFELVAVDERTEWELGAFGIEQPAAGEICAAPAELDVIFVPGVIFGENGERIGMGKGHYDRFLARNHEALRVSLAFDFQCGENIPQMPWDQRVDWVLTEKREFRGENWSRRMATLARSA